MSAPGYGFLGALLSVTSDWLGLTQDAAGNLKPSKARSGEKIDGIAALCMALGRAIVQDDGASVYESRSLIILG